MLDILFALVCVFVTILCVLLTKRYRSLQQQFVYLQNYVFALSEELGELSANADGADDLSE